MKTSLMQHQTKMTDLFRLPLIAEAGVFWYEKLVQIRIFAFS